MTRSEVFEIVKNIFRDVFDDDKLEIKDSTSAKDIKEWDSLVQISLIDAMEKDFKIKFLLQELEKLNNVGDMVDLILKHKNG
jgi:acyl carrier protein